VTYCAGLRIPKNPIRPSVDNHWRLFVAVSGFFRKPITDSVQVLQRFEVIYKILYEIILSLRSFRAFAVRTRPNVACVIIDAASRPILIVISKLHYLHPFGREFGCQIINGSNQWLHYICSCTIGGRLHACVPERIVTQTDYIEVHASLNQFVIVIEIITAVSGTVGMNDDLCVGALFAHSVTTGAKEFQITCPVVAGVVVWRYFDPAKTVHNLIAYLNEIRGSTGVFERL